MSLHVLLSGQPGPAVLLALLIPLIPFALPSGLGTLSITVASVHVFGIPNEIVEALIGGRKISDIILLNTGEGWVTGVEFQRSLVGRIVYSGNSYTLESGDHVYDPSNPVRHPDTLREGGVRFPLKVIETRQDIHLVFVRNERQFRTEFELNQQEYLQPEPDIWPGRTGGFPHFGYIGRYALENGIMASNGDGGWLPAPLSENASLRVNGEECVVSLVIVYSFPFD